MITKEVEEYMLDEGWVFVSYSPLEIDNVEQNSTATGLAARIVIDYYQKELDISNGIWDTD